MNNAILLISALVVHLRTIEHDAPFFRLSDLIMSTSFETMKDLLTTSPSALVHRTAAVFLENVSKNERLAGTIMTDLVNRFLSNKMGEDGNGRRKLVAEKVSRPHKGFLCTS